jgi:hypothetical protein
MGVGEVLENEFTIKNRTETIEITVIIATNMRLLIKGT